MRIILSALTSLLLSSAALADGRPVMVELFTSQGCSSCPPADKFMEELASRPGVVALTMPVDIWDYLGWPDSFARHEFSQRQQDYAALMPSRSVYTPQMVIGGSTDIVGSRRDEAQRLIQSMADAGTPRADLTVTLDGSTVTIDIAAAPSLQGVSANVWMARVLSRGEVTIGDGENRGKVIVYSNVVRELVPIGVWAPETAGHFEAPVESDLEEKFDRIAVFVQKDKQGAVLAASVTNLPPQ